MLLFHNSLQPIPRLYIAAGDFGSNASVQSLLLAGHFLYNQYQPRASKGEVAKYILSYLIRQHFLLILGYCLFIHIIIEASGYLIKYVILLSTLQVDNYTGYVSQIRNQGSNRLIGCLSAVGLWNGLTDFIGIFGRCLFLPHSLSLSLYL